MTPEERRAYDVARRAANPQKFRDQAKARWAADPQKFRDQQNTYRQTPKGHKLHTKANWHTEKLIDSDNDNYEKLYQIYIITTHCNSCIAQFIDSSDRCMDRDHDTNLFRQIICQYCNCHDKWKQFIDKPEDGIFINYVTIRDVGDPNDIPQQTL